MSHIAAEIKKVQQQDLPIIDVHFSLIIPSYNNAQELIRELPALLAYFKVNGMVVEVVIVNDGSSERSALESFCTEYHLQLENHDVNRGKGAAVKTGMLRATNEVRIFTDADIPFQYDVFPDILKKFDNPQVSVVCGDRRKSDYFSKTPPVRRLGSGVFSLMVNVIMLRNLGDTQCGIKAFRKAAVEQVFPKSRITGFAADIEWIYLSAKSGLKIDWVNAEFRNAGESSVVFWKQAVKMLLDVLKLRFRI